MSSMFNSIHDFFLTLTESLEQPIGLVSRLLLLFSGLCLVATFFFPMWHLHLRAPQYSEGLDLYMYSYQLKAGNDGQDLQEINLLNHYIGMAPIEQANFPEMKWMPFALGVIILLTLRSTVFGRIGNILDTLILYIYFSLFSLAVFFFRLYSYGHNLDSSAAFDVEPFIPGLPGKSQIANFTSWSYPDLGTYWMMAAGLCIFASLCWSFYRSPDHNQ